MSGLGHYLEREGIATVCIALVREHAERVRPPRALWVPFPLGRPFGVPDDADFQRRVLFAALGLLGRTAGPVLVDHDEEVPAIGEVTEDAPVCPVSFATPREGDDRLAGVLDEIVGLQPWYDLGLERRARTTVGLSGMSPAECARCLAVFAAGAGNADGNNDTNTLVDRLRWCGEDLKAFYIEAVTAQPGHADGAALETWFWGDTACARLLREVRRRCLASEEAALRDVGDFMLVGAAWSD